jgi:hypothetical protein
MRALAVDRITAEVVNAFDQAGIRSILLKGPSIARWLYPKGGRTWGDSDLLVAPSDFDQACALLEDRGFVHLMDGWAPAEQRLNDSARTYVRSDGVGPCQAVDLHRSLRHLSVPDDVLWSTFSAHTESLRVAGVDVQVLQSTALALHIVVHAVQHGYRHHTSSDFRRLLDALPADRWPEVAALAASVGALECLAVGLRLEPEGAQIADHLGLPTPGVEAPSWWLSSAPRGAASLAIVGAESTWRGKVARVRRTLVPTRARMRYAAGLSPSSRPWAVATAYAGWWRGLARDLPAAVRHVARRRHLTRRSG